MEEKKEYIVRLKDKTKDFTVIYNECFKNKSLSMQAMGLFGYLMTLPNDWEIHKEELVSHFSNGHDAVIKAFNELVEAGYIVVEEEERVKGQFAKKVYKVFEESQGKTKIVKQSRKLSDKHNDETNNGNPITDNHECSTITGNPLTVNPQLLNTNKPSTNNQNSKSHCCGETATKRKSKKSEPTFSNNDYSRVFSIYYANCQILHENGRLDADIPVQPVLPAYVKKLVKLAFVNYGVENVVNAVKESKNHDWLVDDMKYNFTTIFGQNELPMLINKTYSNSKPKSSGFNKNTEHVDLSDKISLGELAFCDDDHYENDYDMSKLAIKTEDDIDF